MVSVIRLAEESEIMGNNDLTEESLSDSEELPKGGGSTGGD